MLFLKMAEIDLTECKSTSGQKIMRPNWKETIIMFFNYSYSGFDITNKLLVSLHSANVG